MISKRVVCLTAVLVLVVCASVNATWDVTYLHPAGVTHSYGVASSAGQQGGYTLTGGVYHAALWNGSSGSYVDLHPAGGNTYSQVAGVSGGRQAGTVRIPRLFPSSLDPMYENRAALWNGSASGWVNLHPSYYSLSMAYGISGNQQVGVVYDEFYNACLWNGTAASFVNLNPAGSNESYAYGTDGTQQVGQASWRACVWSGTAASYMNLAPAWSQYSIAYGVADGQQVGFAYMTPGVYSSHASLWSGTAASWTDLNPAGADVSEAYGVCAGKQVGWARIGGVYHAVIWSGTAGSWVDLNSYLSSGYTGAYAKSIVVSGNDIWIAGHANNAGGWSEAVLWHTTVPEPSGLLGLGTGILGLTGMLRRRR